MLAEFKRIEEDERRILVVSDFIVCIATTVHGDCIVGMAEVPLAVCFVKCV